jgi:hypothetical protein
VHFGEAFTAKGETAEGFIPNCHSNKQQQGFVETAPIGGSWKG